MRIDQTLRSQQMNNDQKLSTCANYVRVTKTQQFIAKLSEFSPSNLQFKQYFRSQRNGHQIH